MQDYIIIGFSTPRDFSTLSWIIKKVERTEFSHVYVKIFSKSLDRYLVYQASGLAVNFCGQDTFYAHNKDIAEFAIPVTPEQKIEILKKCVDLAGKPYGMKDLIGIGLVRLAGLVRWKIRNPFADGSKTYICSEIAATILLMLGFHFQELDSTTPTDVYEKLRGQ